MSGRVGKWEVQTLAYQKLTTKVFVWSIAIIGWEGELSDDMFCDVLNKKGGHNEGTRETHENPWR